MSCFSAWDIQGCGCAPSTCTAGFTIRGCNISILTGETIELRASSGGTVLDTQTSDGSGFLTFTWTGSSGTYWLQPTSPRFAGQSFVITCGTTSYSPILSAATGYTCIASCARPVANTIFATHSLFGAFTLTYSGGAWSGSKTYSYGGYSGFYGTCAAASPTVLISLGTALVYTGQWTDNPASGPCPATPGLGTGNASDTTLSTSSLACPPSFNLTMTGNMPPSTITPGQALMYGADGSTAIPVSITFTE